MKLALGVLTVLVWGSAGWGAELTLTAGDSHVTYSTETLLKHPALKKIAVEADPAYNRSKRVYSAVPLALLFKDLKLSGEQLQDSSLTFKCLDGFSAPIATNRVLAEGPKASRAWIAVEDPQAPWDPVAPSKSPATAGPFYLIWEAPEKSGIKQEEWPFQLASFTLSPGLRAMYPGIFPPGKLAQNHPGMRGLAVFARQCFVCHRMNGEGTSEMGPDLNAPMNPTEYFQPAALKKYIRSPASVRTWKAQIMQGFGKGQISDAEMEDLVAYLKLMVQTRKTKPKTAD